MRAPGTVAMNAQPEYVQRLSAGDPEAERELASRFGPLLRIKVRARVRGAAPSFVDDVVQETFARVLAALRARQIADLERFGAFVNRVCENVIHEVQRTHRRGTSLGASAPEPTAGDDPERAAAHREAAELAERLIRKLPRRDREILDLVLVEEIDKDEVCRRYRITRDHLRVLVHRARERLRAMIEQRRTARS